MTLAAQAPPAVPAAPSPPEARGLARDAVRMMVASPDGLLDTTFRRLANFLVPGDLLVVNTSPTMPAAVRGAWRRQPVGVHLSSRHDDGTWTIELRRPDAAGPIRNAAPGERVTLPRGSLRLQAPADDSPVGDVRLWRAGVEVTGGVRRLLREHGKPIRYAYSAGEWPLPLYQTIFADPAAWPGSAEMPSAARPFSHRLVDELQRRRIGVARIELHTGVSSQEGHEGPQPERYAVPGRTAHLVNGTRAAGGRVIAVGTTVTRALESAADSRGSVSPIDGWTDLVLGPDRSARVVDGIITGWHPPEASHHALLRAVADADVIDAAYDRALGTGYLWHEFGDSCLLLRDGAVRDSVRAILV